VANARHPDVVHQSFILRWPLAKTVFFASAPGAGGIDFLDATSKIIN
jgi:hypothetical protein